MDLHAARVAFVLSSFITYILNIFNFLFLIRKLDQKTPGTRSKNSYMHIFIWVGRILKVSDTESNNCKQFKWIITLKCIKNLS